MINIIYTKGDSVITKVNGVEVEATVVRVTVDIEVKTADDKTWWRALSRLRPADGGVAARGAEQPQPIMDAPLSAASIESQHETTREEIFGAAAEATGTQGGESPAPSASLEPETAATDKSKRRSRKRKR